IDHKTVKDFENALTPFLEVDNPAADTKIILDLKGLEFLTSAGLRMLMIAAKTCGKQSRDIAVAALQPIVQEIFTISRFDLVLKVFPTVPEALETLSPGALPAYERS
ncbi:MAG: STAS domain-containing protein, partial [Desulfobacterales bacterium]|nr:STAS domain-containing protein [Desulfobacterales bacterium]